MSRARTGEWARPGAVPIADGVHRIPLPLPGDGLHAVNVYALEDGDGITLIDGGWAIPAGVGVLTDSLREIGRDLTEISRVLVTHAHVDHYTLAVWLRQRHGVHVAVGRGEKPSLEWLSGDGPRHRHQAARLNAAGAPELAAYMARADGTHEPSKEGWELPDEWLDEGELRVGNRILTVLHTPGHTQGSVVLCSRDDELMFSGDQILPHITPSIGFESVPEQQPLVSFLGSLGRVRSLPDARLLPAHGPADARAHLRIDELIAHHRDRLEATAAAVRAARSATACEVAERLTWTRHQRTYRELDLFNRTLAVNETYAHLAYLVYKGELVATADDVPLYAAP